MFDNIRNFARSLRLPSVADREMAYLNGARDRYDLEHRQREVEAGRFRSNRGF